MVLTERGRPARCACRAAASLSANCAPKPDGVYSMELFADDVAAFMHAIGVEPGHISGVLQGAAT